jgi:polysaccharide biosynthesis protein PslG
VRERGLVVRMLIGLVAMAALVALLVVPAAQAGHGGRGGKGGGKDFFGLNYSFKEITSKDAGMLKKSGAKTVRWIMFWPRIETSSGHFDWSVTDKFVGELAAKGIRVLPIMWGSPRWVEPQAITPPLNTQAARDAWQGFLKAAVKRYGPGGKFWRKSFKRSHQKKPMPITTWDIWNEPNLKGAMNPPSPVLYSQLLDLAHSAITRVDKDADVMFGGLLGHSPSGATAWNFLDQVYDQPGAKKDFDVAAIHAYAGSVSDMLDQVKQMRDVMKQHGDKKTPLWLAEFGWGSLPKNPRNGGQTQGLTGQKKILKKSFSKLKKKRKSLNIGKALWFNFRDPAGGNTQFCAYCTSAGLLKNDYSPKPAWNAFRKFTK